MWNPSRCDQRVASSCSGETTWGVTQYQYDGLGRQKQVTLPDLNTQKTSYDSNVTTFTDEAGNQWARTADALGRLTQVLEPNGQSTSPIMETDYVFDALNNLKTVTQWGGPHGSSGARTRSFIYDSLSRLTSAFNPETGTTSYVYDANGNVTTKTGARGIQQRFFYDALNRLTTKNFLLPSPTPAGYSSSPWSTYVYDTLTIDFGSSGNAGTSVNAIGRMVEAYTTVGASNRVTDLITMNYDPMGRLQGRILCLGDCRSATNQPLFAALTFFDFAGNPTTVASLGTATHTLNQNGTVYAAIRGYTYDSVGRIQNISHDVIPVIAGTQGTEIDANLFSATAYSPAGLAQANLSLDNNWGNPKMNLTRTYDNRMRVLSETDKNSSNATIYSYANGYDRVGNVNGFTDSVMGQWGFGYDTLNRLSSANVINGMYGNVNIAGATMGWTYDPFGNRTAQNASTGTLPIVTSTYNSLNQISIPAVTPYDGDGDIIDDGTYQYKYDADNRVCAVYRYHSPMAMTGYLYDALGNRVAKGAITGFYCDPTPTGNGLLANPGTMTNYVVGLNGEQQDEYDGTGSNLLHSNVFGNGELLATMSGSTWKYAFNDWLGTKRVQITTDGNLANRSTFQSFPFGDGLYPSGSDATEQHFTGKERDTESGNDYFGARYYFSTTGRFLSPDWSAKAEPVPYAKFGDSQSLNLYTYSRNNPLTLVDPDGHNFGDGLDCGGSHASGAACPSSGSLESGS